MVWMYGGQVLSSNFAINSLMVTENTGFYGRTTYDGRTDGQTTDDEHPRVDSSYTMQ